jgi:hypothetical protein
MFVITENIMKCPVGLYILVFQEVMACSLVDSTISKNTSYFRVA